MKNGKITKRDQAEDQMKAAINELNFRAYILRKFCEYVSAVHDRNIEITDSIEGGTKKYNHENIDGERRGRALDRRESLLSSTLLFKGIMMLQNETIAGDLDSIVGGPDREILFDSSYKKLRNKLRNAVLQFFSTFDDEGTIDERAKERHKQQVQLWRHTLELSKVELYLAGKNSASPEVKEVDMFLRIIEGKK